jgi:hypothetical protein
MQGRRRMCKKLLTMLMCVCVLIAGCSKQPLNSMTMGEVRQLVDEWSMGKLPEQQETDAKPRIPSGSWTKHSVKTFYKVFGEPKERSLIGDSYYFQYRCKDGIVILDIQAWHFDYDRVIINGVSVL